MKTLSNFFSKSCRDQNGNEMLSVTYLCLVCQCSLKWRKQFCKKHDGNLFNLEGHKAYSIEIVNALLFLNIIPKTCNLPHIFECIFQHFSLEA